MKGILLNKTFTNIFFVLIGILVLVFLSLQIVKLLGYKFNKEFFSYNQQECVDREMPTYYHHPGIEGCIFWVRNNYLEKQQNWQNDFQRDDTYCDEKYPEEYTRMNNRLYSLEESNDVRCSYSVFQDQKRKENWEYLISKEKDGIYYYCIEQICPNQPLFR